ncbi:MAG: MBL fold metallo-hydrolase, partial [Chitinophagaceae bacterium]
FVDSPLSLKATQTIKQYTSQFNERLQQVLAVDDDPFDFPGLTYIESVDESRELVKYSEPCVIISASGTADAGRVRHHINNILADAKNGVLMVGYCSAKSLGGQLIGGEKEVEIFSDPVEVKAEIGQLPGMSAHGDCDDLCRFVSGQEADKVRAVFLVHGERETQKSFAAKLELKGFKNVVMPAQHQEVILTSTDDAAEAA